MVPRFESAPLHLLAIAVRPLRAVFQGHASSPKSQGEVHAYQGLLHGEISSPFLSPLQVLSHAVFCVEFRFFL